MRNANVFDMVRQVITDAQEKLASQSGSRETGAAAEKTKTASTKAAPKQVSPSFDPLSDWEKVASACDYLAANIHLVADTRSPQEKLAELAALQEEFAKLSADDPPKNPPLDSGVGPGGPNSAMQTTPATTAGGSILEGGDSGQATGENQPPKQVEPNEKPTPTQSSNALETNLEDPPGGTADYPEGLGKQAMAKKLAQLVASGQIRKEAAAVLIKQAMSKKATSHLPPGFAENAAKVRAAQDPSKPGAEKPDLGAPGKKKDDEEKKKEAARLAKLAKDSKAPPNLASALLRKFAEDAINPAQISAGTTPELQSVPGVPSAQMQGSEAGQMTPSTRGDTTGRDLVSSNEAAINATKKDAKHGKTQSGMAPYLDEPAMSSAHDNVLNKSLDNTSSAGVKIAADSARALLDRWANKSPANREKLAQAIKKANAEMGYGPAAGGGVPGATGPTPGGGVPGATGGLAGGGVPGEPAPMPGSAMGMNKLQEAGEGEAPAVSDQALAAAAEGVTPEELEQAMALLGAAEGGDEAGLAAAPASPQVGGEAPPAA
jgi:hypothetical protein